MSTTDNSPLPHISEIMNKKLEKRSRREVRKMKISRVLFGEPDRKSPEITPKILGKRRREDRVVKSRRSEISPTISVLNSQQSEDTPVSEPG